MESVDPPRPQASIFELSDEDFDAWLHEVFEPQPTSASTVTFAVTTSAADERASGLSAWVD